MRSRTRLWAAAAVLALLPAPWSVAEAKGEAKGVEGVALRWDQTYYQPGDLAIATAEVRLGGTRPEYRAFIWPGPTTRSPGRVRGERISLPPPALVPRDDGSATVALQFHIPELRSGYYWVTVCPVGCSDRERVLSTSQINVVADDSEERVLDLALRVSADVGRSARRFDRALRQQERRVAALERRIAALEAARPIDDRALTSGLGSQLVVPGAVASGLLLCVLWLHGRSRGRT
jgi:hypothetical protein